MALEAVVYPQDAFGYKSCKDFLFHDLYFQEDQDRDHKDTKGIQIGQEGFVSSTLYNINNTLHNINNSNSKNSNLQAIEDHQWHDQHSPPSLEGFYPVLDQQTPPQAQAVDVASTAIGRRKRRRTKSSKNKEEIENQRMTHIAVERNRRKQMNDYLAVLRSLMPPSYAQRGDQASIIGGAINYVKELEHLLQSMEPQGNNNQNNDDIDGGSSSNSSYPFSGFFSSPQYSSPSSAAEIEVTMVESHANLKILSKKRPKQLLKLVNELQSLKLTVLHLNVSTLNQSVLYSLSLKVEEGSQLNTVDDIAAAVNQILRRCEEDSAF